MAVNRYYSSTAVDTTLAVGISASATSMTVSSVVGFPTSYPYTLAVDYDTSSEELVNIVGASGTTLTIGLTAGVADIEGRGVDQGAGYRVAHNAGAVVKHIISGRDVREPQEHIAASTNVHGIADTATLITASSTTILTNKSLTAPVLTGTIDVTSGTLALGTTGVVTANSTTISAAELGYLDGATSNLQTQISTKAPIASPTFTGTVSATISSSSTIGGISGTIIAADHAAWISSTPTISSGWTGTPTLRYIQIGKTVNFHFTFSVATGGSTATDMTVTLPVVANTANSIRWTSSGEFLSNAGTRYLTSAPITTSAGVTTFVIYCPSNSTPAQLVKLTPTAPTTSSGGDTVSISGTYEAA